MTTDDEHRRDRKKLSDRVQEWQRQMREHFNDTEADRREEAADRKADAEYDREHERD